MNADRLLTHYERIADAPDAIVCLRRFILDLAVRGKLVEQDPNDEPVSELLKRIAAEKARLVKAGEIKKAVVNPIDLNDAPFHLPLDWIWSTVGELMHVEMGQSPPSEHYNQSGEGLPFYQGKTDFGPRHPSPRYWCTQPKKLALPGDILISVRAPVGPTNLTEIKCCIGRGLAALKSYAGAETDFALMSLRAFEPSIAAMGFGSTFVAINKRQLALFPFPLPPLAEQRRIVAKVDELMALCDRLEAARAEREATRDRLTAASLARLNAPDPNPSVFKGHAVFALKNFAPLTTRLDQIKALRQTILNFAVRGKLVKQDRADEPASELLKRSAAEKTRLVREKKRTRVHRASTPAICSDVPFDFTAGWSPVKIEQTLVEIQTGPFGSSLHQSDYQLGGTPVINPASIQNERIVPVDKMAVGPVTLERLASFKLRTGDVIMGRRGEMGRCAVVSERESGWLCGTGSLILRALECIYPRFLSMLIGSPLSRQYLGGTAVGTTMQNLNQTILLNLSFGIPPLTEQHRIVAKVDELMALCDRLEASLADSDTTRQRLLETLLHEALAPAAAREIEMAE